jgi:hypothetical protein
MLSDLFKGLHCPFFGCVARPGTGNHHSKAEGEQEQKTALHPQWGGKVIPKSGIV